MSNTWCHNEMYHWHICTVYTHTHTLTQPAVSLKAVLDFGSGRKLAIFTNMAQIRLPPKCNRISVFGRIYKTVDTNTAMFRISTSLKKCAVDVTIFSICWDLAIISWQKRSRVMVILSSYFTKHSDSVVRNRRPVVIPIQCRYPKPWPPHWSPQTESSRTATNPKVTKKASRDCGNNTSAGLMPFLMPFQQQHTTDDIFIITPYIYK